jgi:methylase of polypeptide subunit release factors
MSGAAKGPRATRRPLTQVAQAAIAEILRPGSLAIDGTMGNGHDTLFLARCVAPGGRVVAFDVQPAAIDATRRRLLDAGLDGLVELRQVGHEHLASRLPDGWSGRVDAVMFNLGYLPGGDKSIVTTGETTTRALTAALGVMSAQGRLSVMLYRHHADARPEVDAVGHWLSGLSDSWSVTRHCSPGPLLYIVQRTR